MRARYDHVEALLKIKNRTAVQTALDHLLDMLRLNRSDNMGLRALVPALCLRLNKDQQAYDFLKWWYTTATDDHYDWGNIDLPRLDIVNADASEPLQTLNMEYSDLSHRAMLFLLKWRLQSGLQALDSACVIAGDKVPSELLTQIRLQMLSSAAQNNVTLMRDVEHGRDIEGHIGQLAQQSDILFDALSDANKCYWATLAEPGDHLTARPPHYSQGTVSEMQLSLSQTYDAWVETPGALEWVKSKVAA